MIDWQFVAARVAAEADGLRWPIRVWEQRAYRAHVAGVEQRLDNFGRALAGAAMLATVELRAEKRAFRIAFERMESHLWSGWHLGAP